MPTQRERDYYRMGFMDGQRGHVWEGEEEPYSGSVPRNGRIDRSNPKIKRKQKLSAWNKYVKANSKKPRFRFANGKLKLKKMAIAWRKTPAGKKRKR